MEQLEGRRRGVEIEAEAGPAEVAPAHAPRLRRLATRRVAAAAGGAAVVVALALATPWGSAWSRALLARLYGRSVYRADWQATELVEPPPPWIKSGRAGLLASVAAQAGLPVRPSVVDLDLDEVRRAFEHHPWVAEVLRVERSFPNRLRVRLRYRRPAAVVALGGPGGTVLDAEGVVLPAEDCERSACGFLPTIQGLPDRLDARAGIPLKVGGSDDAPPHRDPIVEAAARLAATLASHGARPDATDPPADLTRVLVNGPELWASSANPARLRWVLWAHVPADATEPPPDDPSKWDRLRSWFSLHGPDALHDPDFLEFHDGQPLFRRGRRLDSSSPQARP
ncbi:MAG TPA: FtsQ-type POTRA domain-containing protein [Isosphaeraceae bacterium]|nr:FtsQ-type POTRA domain-containing protein [Isosphaeraceae bacterium]